MKSNKDFTLTKLVLVNTILGIFSRSATPNGLRFQGRTKKIKVNNTVLALSRASEGLAVCFHNTLMIKGGV